jgi:hypothetical protein
MIKRIRIIQDFESRVQRISDHVVAKVLSQYHDLEGHACSGKPSFVLSTTARNIEARPPICSQVMAIHRGNLTSIIICISNQARPPDLLPTQSATRQNKTIPYV